MTTAGNDITKSDINLISVIFHDLSAGDTYRAGKPTSEVVIFGHIRKGNLERYRSARAGTPILATDVA